MEGGAIVEEEERAGRTLSPSSDYALLDGEVLQPSDE
jgi:hypothetical protein